MKEQEAEVRTFVVRAMCEQCNGGEMEPTITVLISHPPQYPHKCNFCGHVENLRDSYPLTRHKEVKIDK